MSTNIRNPSIGSRNIQKEPFACVRMIESLPPGLRLSPGFGVPNELVGLFNGYSGSIQLYVISADATRLIPVVS